MPSNVTQPAVVGNSCRMPFADGGLPAPRLAHQRQRAVRGDLQGHAVHRLHVADDALEEALADREIHFQVVDLQQRSALQPRPAELPGDRPQVALAALRCFQLRAAIRRVQMAPHPLPATDGRPSAALAAGSSDQAQSQRSAKRQPVKTRSSGGTVPGITASGRSRPAPPGNASNSLRRVRDAPARRRSRRAARSRRSRRHTSQRRGAPSPTRRRGRG